MKTTNPEKKDSQRLSIPSFKRVQKTNVKLNLKGSKNDFNFEEIKIFKQRVV